MFFHREKDALAYKPKALPGDAREAVNHIKKRKLKNNGAEIVFDPNAHKYV